MNFISPVSIKITFTEDKRKRRREKEEKKRTPGNLCFVLPTMEENSVVFTNLAR